MLQDLVNYIGKLSSRNFCHEYRRTYLPKVTNVIWTVHNPPIQTPNMLYLAIVVHDNILISQIYSTSPQVPYKLVAETGSCRAHPLYIVLIFCGNHVMLVQMFWCILALHFLHCTFFRFNSLICLQLTWLQASGCKEWFLSLVETNQNLSMIFLKRLASTILRYVLLHLLSIAIVHVSVYLFALLFLQVSVLSLDPTGESNWTTVTFGVWPYPSNFTLSPTELSILRSSLVSLVIRQSILYLTPSLFGNSSSFEILRFPGGITIIPPQTAFVP